MIIVQVAGRLGKDPETRFTPSGQKVTNLTVATNVRKGGKEETVWWRVTIWGDRFDKMVSYLKKGSAIIAIGDMNKPDIWTDKEGRSQVSLEMTADVLRFSPFGNSDSNKQDQTTENTAQGASNDGDFSKSSDSNGMSSQYGTAQGTSSGKFNQAIPHSEEQLPF